MEKVIKYLKEDLKLTYGDTIVIGVSGGPDSMALLSMMIDLQKEMELDIVCAHVNHNLRSESDAEALFVQDFCKKYAIPFESIKIDEYGDDNFHNEARTLRYKYFKKLIQKYHAKYLFTAHHADDLMETILMRIVRGSTLGGYSGFSKKIDIDGYTIVRPLINIAKEELIQYNKEKGISYVTDGSNEKDTYTRNRFRKYIVADLKKEDPNVHEKFYKFSRVLQENNKYIDRVVQEKLPKIYPQKVLNIEKFLQEEKIIQNKILYYILEHIYQDDLMLITDQHVQLLHNLIASEKPSGYIYLPNKITAVKSYNSLTLTKHEKEPDEYNIEFCNIVNLADGKNIERVEHCDEDTNYVCRLLSSEIKMPLYVRNRREGDRMTIKGMLGRKKINDIFIDEKVAVQERKKWPVVVDSTDTIVWLPGLKKSKFNKTKNEKYDIILKYY